MAPRDALKTQEVDQLISVPIGQPGSMSCWCFLLSRSAVTHIDPITAVITQFKVSMLPASAPALACLVLLLLLVHLEMLLGWSS